jgi:hypothetical protein
MTQELNPFAGGIAHSTAERTRLRVPAGFRDRAKFKAIEAAVESIAGVKYVECNDRTGSILVYHEDKPGILALVGQAIETIDPALFLELLKPEEPKEDQLKRIVEMAKDVAQRRMPRRKPKSAAAESGAADGTVGGKELLKTAVPLAFIVAGVVRVIETESFWAGLPPLILFYYAFDTYWKFNTPEQESAKSQVQP